MDFSEYVAAQQLVMDGERRYRTYMHVGTRLQQRCHIPRRNWSLALWQQISYACATRQLEVVLRDNDAIYCKSSFFGKNVIWVYSRSKRCVATVYNGDETDTFRLQYLEEKRKFR